MTETQSIIIKCDQCGIDLSPYETAYPRDDIIILSCENIARHTGGFTFSILQTIPFNTKHFCNLICLSEWVEANKTKYRFPKTRAESAE